MRRSLSRAGSSLMAVLAWTALQIVLPMPAEAQSPSGSPPAPSVVLRLVSQSAWNGPGRPLDLSFTARNDGPTALGALSVVVAVGAPARSRTTYELSLRTDATTFVFGQSYPQAGSLEPGTVRTFRVRQRLDQTFAPAEEALYPLRIQLLSGDQPVGTIRSPMIYLVENPKVPLNLEWTWVFSEPLQYGPDGVFAPGPLERDIAPGGRLQAMASALDGRRSGPVDMALSTVLVDQLQRMSRGYRIADSAGSIRVVPKATGGSEDAARLLAALGRVAARPSTEVVATPFGDPTTPSLIRAGLTSDLPALSARARSLIERALGTSPRADVARPVLSQLDAASVGLLAGTGTRTVLVDPYFLPTPAGLQFSPPPVARLFGGGRSVTAVVPDPGVATVAATYRADPVLDAHAALGELAAVWFEFPGTPGRGTAVLFPERSALSPAFYGTFASLVRHSPWLRPVAASGLESLSGTPARQAIPARRYPGLDPEYVSRLLSTRAAVTEFAGTAQGARQTVELLRDQLLLLDGSAFVADPGQGDRFLDAAMRTIQATYDRVRITSKLVTLTSRSGVLPVTLENDTGYPVKVELRFVADRRLVFVNGATHELVLQPATRTYTFRVRAQTTGRFPIKVQLRTPGGGPGAATIAETQMIVRSTAYNRVALLVTIGAALFLAAWWGRRFIPRRKRA